MFWTIYFVGVAVSILFMAYIAFYEEKNSVTKYKWTDFIGLLLFGLLWPCFVLQIIFRILDILIG